MSDSLRTLSEHLESDLQEQQTMVRRKSAAVQKQFMEVAKFTPIENATRLGSEQNAKVRKEMWELLCAQVESGLGMPTEQQLAALWTKYDGNSDCKLSATEMRGMLVDFAAAMTSSLSKHLPVLTRRLQQSKLSGKLHPIVETVSQAFVYQTEAQLSMYRSQSEGRVTDAALKSVMTKFDKSRDGIVTRDEFMANASTTFFSNLLDDLTNDAMVASLSAAAADTSSKPSVVFQSLEKAEREARAAQDTVNAARKRIASFTSYEKRILEDAHHMEEMMHEGAKAMLQWREKRTAEALQAVRSEGASTLVSLELAVSGGSDDDARSNSVRMFGLLSKQLVAGMGKPGDQQLLALWSRYDEDRTGTLSKGELGHLITDYATARAREIESNELPSLKAMMDAEVSNQFVTLLSRARLMAKEAELALFQSQAEGQISVADLNAAFSKLDVNRDGVITKDEFLRGASDVLFRTQIERLKNWKGLVDSGAVA